MEARCGAAVVLDAAVEAAVEADVEAAVEAGVEAGVEARAGAVAEATPRLWTSSSTYSTRRSECCRL